MLNWRFLLPLCLLSAWSWSPTSSAASFTSACEKYDDHIRTTVKQYWADLPDWLWWRAQVYAESGCNPQAQSGVGAKGLAQILDGTWRDLIRMNGIPGAISPFDARWSVELGGVYQMKQRLAWRAAGRTAKQRNDLGLCSYNRGIGNCVSDQKECNGAVLWDDIAACTARHTMETVNYVKRINKYHADMGRR